MILYKRVDRYDPKTGNKIGSEMEPCGVICDFTGKEAEYPEKLGVMLKAGEVAKISIFTPHECISQKHSGKRQFFRVVGKGVTGREDYFTVNPLLS